MFVRVQKSIKELSRKWKGELGVISGKAYNTRVDVNPLAYQHLADHLLGAYNCQMVATLVKENLNTLTDRHLALAITQITRFQFELDEHFYNVLLPIVKEYFKQLDWEANRAIGEIVRDCGELEVDDDELFRIFESRLVEQQMYRYLSLDQMVDIYNAFNKNNRGSEALINIFETEFIKHRKAVQLDSKLMDKVHMAMVTRGRDSDQVLQLLEEGIKYQQIA